MDEKDLEAIGNIIDKKVGENLVPISSKLEELEKDLSINTASVMRIEGKIGTVLELRKDVAQVREQVKDHEERISNLEI